jgi:DNA polymerase
MNAGPENSQSVALGLLRWLAEAGAGEAVAEAPIDRFALAAAAKTPPPDTSPVLPMRSPQGAPPPSAAPPSQMTKNAEAVSLGTWPGTARAQANACTTLAELKAALETFEGCELKRTAKHTVFADGNPKARIMLIGEAPGREEDELGLPFVGRAGKLLDLMLAAVGLDRTRVYITNVLPWRPPQNREPSPEEAAVCLPFLHRHIALAEPALIVLLGGTAARHVLGTTEGILRTRGRWNVYHLTQNSEISTAHAIPVMPTLHPAYLLRQPAAKRLAWRDLLAVAAKAEELNLLGKSHPIGDTPGG